MKDKLQCRLALILILFLVPPILLSHCVEGVENTLAQPNRITNTQAIGEKPFVSKDIIAFYSFEGACQRDLNGDGKITDINVIRYYNISSKTVINTGVVVWYLNIGDNIIGLRTYEGAINQDLNGDGDQTDFIIEFYNITSGTLTNTREVGYRLSVSGGVIAFRTDEDAVGQDLNGDGDQTDPIIRYHNITSGTTTNTKIVAERLSISGDIIAFQVNESSINRDLNEDGDRKDFIVQFYKIAIGTETNTRADGELPFISGNIIAFQTLEKWVNQDLNGDGDKDDSIIRYYDVSTGALTDTHAVGWYPSVGGNLIAFSTYEGDVGQDLNGDEDQKDQIIRYYNITDGRTTNTGVVGEWPSVSNGIIAFDTYEYWIGQDLNGDGDKSDPIIQYYNTTQHPPYWPPPVAVTLKMPSPSGVTENSIALSWTQNNETDFNKYEVYKSTASGALGTLVTTINDGTNTTCTVAGLLPDTTYYFTVRTVDKGGLHTDSGQIAVKTNQSTLIVILTYVAVPVVFIGASLVVYRKFFRKRKKTRWVRKLKIKSPRRRK